MAQGQRVEISSDEDKAPSANTSQEQTTAQLQRDAKDAFNDTYFAARSLRNEVSGLPPEQRRNWLKLEKVIAESPDTAPGVTKPSCRNLGCA